MGTADIIPLPSRAADEKAALIHTAWNAMQAATRRDEREQLNDADVATWCAWYDATTPQVHDIKILAGAMEIELLRRRGERLLQEEEKRGGDTVSKQSKVSHRDTLVEAEKQRRKRARHVAAHPKEVNAYVKRQVAAKQVPTVRGALRVATAASPKADRRTISFEAAQVKVEHFTQKVLTILDELADGQMRTDRELTRRTGDVEHFLRRIRLIPWLFIERTAVGTRFIVDHELRDICELRQPRPPKGESLQAWLTRVRAEIVQRRKENQDKHIRSKGWTPHPVNVQRQSELLDWIEAELLRITQS